MISQNTIEHAYALCDSLALQIYYELILAKITPKLPSTDRYNSTSLTDSNNGANTLKTYWEMMMQASSLVDLL